MAPKRGFGESIQYVGSCGFIDQCVTGAVLAHAVIMTINSLQVEGNQWFEGV